MTDEAKRDHLVKRAHAMTGQGSPVVSIAEFFDGNGDMASIAPNLIDHPGLARFEEVFAGIERRADVASVWAQLDLEWAQYPVGEWPFATRVIIVTTANPKQVDEWVANLEADPCYLEQAAQFPAIGTIPTGCNLVCVWWD